MAFPAAQSQLKEKHMIASKAATTRLALAAGLFGLLYCLYLLTFAGVFSSNDEHFILSTVESWVHYHSLLLGGTTYLQGLQTFSVEPVQPALSAPLFWIALRSPGVGLVQTVFLFNPIVTALTAVVLFYFALDLGYDERIAALGALLFGATTIAWPYAQTYFRESLSMLVLLATAFCLNRWRAAFEDGRPHLAWLAVGVVTLVLSLFTKEGDFVAVPMLLVAAIPEGKVWRARRRQLLTVGVGLAVLVGLVVLGMTLLLDYTPVSAMSGRYKFDNRLADLVRGMTSVNLAPALAGLLISPGKSVFVYSPVTALALGAPFVLPRRRWREVWLSLGLLLVSAIVYAAIRGPVWHGGSSWGPRYLVPLTPMLMLGALPLIERMARASHWWPRAGLAGLALVGVLAQVGGLLVNIYDYYAVLGQIRDDAAWTLGVWNPYYAQIVGHWRMLLSGEAGPHVAWLIPAPDWPVIAAILCGVVLFGVTLIRLWRGKAAFITPAQVGGGTLIGLAVLVGLSSFGLHHIADDPRWNGDNPYLRAMLAFVEESSAPDDGVLLSSPSYNNFFTNYYRGDALWMTAPLSPGERYSFEQQPKVVSDNPDDLIDPEVIGLIRWFRWGRSLWLVVDSGPYLPWSVRPAEWWCNENLYRVSTHEFAPNVRVVRYLLYPPPENASPNHRVGARLGDDITLIGYHLSDDGKGVSREEEIAGHPLDVYVDMLTGIHAAVKSIYSGLVTSTGSPPIFKPGSTLTLALYWQAVSTPGADYTVGVYLINPEGQMVLQQDSQPVGGFRPTSGWMRGRRVPDYYGFILPADLPPGRYQIWVAMYEWPSLERLPVTGPDGDDWGDHVALAEIEIRAGQ
jgi:hypothetical protein